MREVCFRHPCSAYLGGRHGGSIQTIHTVAIFRGTEKGGKIAW